MPEALQEVLLSEPELNEAAELLRYEKYEKDVVLQGPPGVGKTFIASRLARLLLGARDPERVTQVQFHPSYSYEDFIQGFRSSADAPPPAGAQVKREISTSSRPAWAAAGRRMENRLGPHPLMADRVMAARGVGRSQVRAVLWLAIGLLMGCAKATDESRASSAPSEVLAASKKETPEKHREQPAHEPPRPTEAPPPASPDDPRFTLLVSNQSSVLPRVDIQLRIDGRRVVDDTFALGMGHTVKTYEFQLTKGRHQLQATAHDGAATYQAAIDIQAELWGALLFWRSPQAGAGGSEQRPAFSFQTQDSPIQLR